MILWLDLTTGELFYSGFLQGLFCALEPLEHWTGRSWKEFDIIEVTK